MTEKQKMLSGELYFAGDEELAALRKRCRLLLDKINSSPFDDFTGRQALFTELFGYEPEFYIQLPFYCDYGTNIKIGKNTEFNFGVCILDCAEVTIGESCLIAPNVQFYAATHPIDPEVRKSGKELAKPINIGNNVWIGGNSVICPGVTIGDNSVIGAGSVVCKDIPANVVAVGNPCRVVKSL